MIPRFEPALLLPLVFTLVGCGAARPTYVGEPIANMAEAVQLETTLCEREQMVGSSVTVTGAAREGAHIVLKLRHGGCGEQRFSICRSPDELMSMPPQTEYFIANVTTPESEQECRVYRETIIAFESESRRELPSSIGENRVRLSMPTF